MAHQQAHELRLPVRASLGEDPLQECTDGGKADGKLARDIGQVRDALRQTEQGVALAERIFPNVNDAVQALSSQPSVEPVVERDELK